VPKINKTITLNEWCSRNGYDGVTKECVMSAFNSDNPDIIKLAKREKLKGLIKDGKREER
tara:strand:- start:216 stop:395 length:180 start_codon:yes stop_codon:yes gene_type:complete